ncbi:MAG: LytTR family DNA-binding domain-containing protein [Bacteroidota bacterium]|nr:DNA-binding response regulator [Odoribacter sp.]MDP3643786.1 LytTR family DNA-binding domain-containing protein [Bacteroidota bacterium]
MYHAVIIDDDQLARRGLKRILELNFKEIEILGEANSVASGLSLINQFEPDLVFLDIELPDGTGFSLLEKLTKVNFRVIFTTSYSDYAIKAFKYSAFDYITKPVLIENVRSTMNRISEIPVLNEKHRVEALKQNLTRNSEDDPTIALPEINGFTIVRVKDIVRCEGERNYSRIFFINGNSVLVSLTLLDFDNLLAPHGFFRIHRSHLISLKNVNRYLKTDGGMIEMADKTQLPVSPKFKDDFLNRLLYNRL